MRVMILPGLGADSRMYADGRYKRLEGVEFRDWPDYGGEKSIEEPARRIIDEMDIRDGDMVGESSPGGTAAADGEFIRAMARAVFEWDGNPDPDCELNHIQGGRDRVIHAPAYEAEIIRNGGHLIAMTHADETADFIEYSINQKSGDINER